jgi:hypothetical protein
MIRRKSSTTSDITDCGSGETVEITMSSGRSRAPVPEISAS